MASSYTLLDEAVHEAASDAEATLSSFASALLAIEAETDPQAVQTRLRHAGNQADAARAACREFELELEGATDLPEDELARLSTEYQAAARRLQQQLGTLEFLRKARRREALLASAGSQLGVDADKASPSTLIAMGLKVQLESQLAVNRMTRVVESTKQIGAQTLATLETQHSRLQRVYDTASAQAAQFELAERELKEYAQSALGDTVTQTLVILILLSLFFLISLRLSSVPSQTHTPAGLGAADAAGSIGAGGWRQTVLPPLSLLTR
jgi:hypothetical protein